MCAMRFHREFADRSYRVDHCWRQSGPGERPDALSRLQYQEADATRYSYGSSAKPRQEARKINLLNVAFIAYWISWAMLRPPVNFLMRPFSRNRFRSALFRRCSLP